MKTSLKKRGQKIAKKFSRVSVKASRESKEHIKENLFARVSHIQNIKLLIFEWCLLAVALIMLAITQAFWYSDSYEEDTFVRGGTFTEATVGKVNSMNPLFASTNSERALSKLMFETLVANDYTGHPGMGLAKSIIPDDEGKVWTMKLKDNLKWSDGEPLTNEDVMYTFELIQNPLVITPYSANLSGVKISEAEDGSIIFKLTSPYADFISVLDIPIVPKHELGDTSPNTLVEDEFSIKPVTSGPFMPNATQTTSNSIERTIYLSPNPNYYGQKPMLSGFAIHTYESIEDVLNAVNSGTVTATAELSGLAANGVTASQFIRKESSINWGAYAFFNTASGSMKNKELRQAIQKGIDMGAVRAAAPNTVAVDYPIITSQMVLEHYPKLPERNFEESASKIAGLKGEKTIAVNLVTAKTGYLPAVAEALAEQIRSLGLEVNVTAYDENQEFISNVIQKRYYDILVYDVELDADPDPLPYYHSSQISSGLNLSNYRNSLVDDLLIGARGTIDKKLRIKKYESFLSHWAEDVPAIGIYQANLTYVYNKNVRVYGNDVRLVSPIDRFVDVESWAVDKGTKSKTP